MCMKQNECSQQNPISVRYSAAYILRLCHHLTQKQAASMANVTQADICEMEKYKPYGRLSKYIRLAKVYNVPVETLIKNDLRAVPAGALNLPEWDYVPPPNSAEGLLGRQGEDLALRLEQDRLKRVWPALSDLVFPYYKVSTHSPGFDILSLNDFGRPFALEVKTSLGDDEGFWLTPNEMSAAEKLTAEGVPYVIRLITNWGTEQQNMKDISFSAFPGNYKIIPQSYRVVPERKPNGTISGLTYWRQERELKQIQLAEMLGVNQYELSLYENGSRQASVEFYIKASDTLDVTVDQLIESYEQ